MLPEKAKLREAPMIPGGILGGGGAAESYRTQKNTTESFTLVAN